MKSTILETRNLHQDIGETIFYEIDNRLFKLFYRIDESYHSQSRAYLEVMGSDNELKRITDLDVWQFGYYPNPNNKRQKVDIYKFKKFVEKQIKNFVKFTKPTKKGIDDLK